MVLIGEPFEKLREGWLGVNYSMKSIGDSMLMLKIEPYVVQKYGRADMSKWFICCRNDKRLLANALIDESVA